MKKQSLGKQFFSLFLALTLVLGMVGAIPLSAKADEDTAENKILADELTGYTRITATEFETSSNERLGKSFQLQSGSKTFYVGNYNGLHYLDVDVNFEGDATGTNYLRYFGNPDVAAAIYTSAFTVRMKSVANVYFVEFGYQDEATKLNTVVPTKEVVASDYGIEGPSSYFNVKILTDLSVSKDDETKEVITYQFWLNDQFVCEGSFEETVHKRMGLSGQVSAGKKITVKVPGEKTVVDPFAGYNRITLADYNTTMDGALNASLAHGAQLTYQGTDDLNMTYIDLDVNYNGNVHYSNFMLRFYGSDRYKDSYHLSWETAGQLIITRYDNAQNFTILDRVYNLTDYGISGPSDWFNVKVKFDVTPNASDATKQTVKLQLWLNNKLAWEKSIEETNAASNRNKIFVNANGGTISARVPMNVEEEMKGYTPITLNDFDGTKTIQNGKFVSSLANGKYIKSAVDFNKSYIDLDVNYNGTVGKGGSNLRFQSSGQWTDCYALGWNEDGTSLHLFRYTNESKIVDLATSIPAANYGISGPDAWFNVKLRTDIIGGDTTQQTVKLQLWLNNKLAWIGTLEETRASASRASIYASVYGGNTLSLRSNVPSMEDSLKGYTPITLDEYKCDMNIRGEVDVKNAASINALVSNFNKTYLDVDVNFGGAAATQRGHANFRYQASGQWTDSYVLGWKNATTLDFFNYRDGSTVVDLNANIVAADYGISGPSDWFNVKIATEITVDASNANKQTVKLQLWLNNQLAYSGTHSETRKDPSRAAIWVTSAVAPQKITFRSPRIVEEELTGYTRVTLEDVQGLGAARAEKGTTYLSARSGQYVGGSFDKTYLDMDVQSTAGCFLTYLMSQNTFWGNDRYQFELTGTNLKITPVYGGTGMGSVTLGLDSVGYTAGDMFNLKIRTDIDGQTVIMQFWFNNNYVAMLTFEEPAERTINCMGIRGTGTGATVVRTPMTGVTREEVAYDLSKGAYLLTGADYFYVNGKKMSSGTVLAAPNDYVVERVVDGQVADSKLVALYYLGDVNLDGSAFVNGDSVWMDGHALQGIVNYGTPMKSAMIAADINNDGKVTLADFDEFVKIRSDVSLKDEVLSKYHTDSLSYEYLGGKNVMPIGGFYGPYSDVTITDNVFQLIKDSGINLITYTPANAETDEDRLQQVLVLAEKYGIGVFASDAGLNVIEKDENGNVTGTKVYTSAEELAEIMGDYANYDSFLGINIVDEPKGANDWATDTNSDVSNDYFKRYNYYRDLAQALSGYTNITSYINMHGSQSTDKGTYSAYVNEIAKDVDVLSFDSYPYFDQGTYTQMTRLAAYLESLDIVRQASLDSGKSFWSYVQAGTDYRDDGSKDATTGYYTEADTLWIVNTSLAFGAKGIQYFPLIQPEHFSYNGDGYDYDRNGIIGANNEVNRYYAMVQNANKQIAAIDEILMNATSTGVIVTGSAANDVSLATLGREHNFSGILEKKNNTYTAMLNGVSAASGSMVGVFDYQGYEAYYVVNYNRTEGATQQITLTLNENVKYRIIADAVTSNGEGDTITMTIPSGAGVLVVLETEHTHAYGDWTVVTPATVANPGEKAQFCVCGDKISEEIPCLANVESWNLTLGGDLAVNFVIDVHEDIADTAKIKITVAGVEYTYDAAEKVTVNVAAAQMNDEITVRIVDGNDTSAVKTYTVLQYAQYVLADESLSNYHQLVKEMLNYGGFAQIYFEYNDENPVNADVEGVGAEEVPADAAPEMAVSGKVDGISFYGASLLFRNKIAVRYYFTVSGDISSYTFTVNGVEYQPELKEEGLYYIEVADINPQDLDDAIIVAVNETLTVSYSPMNYIVRMSTKGTENLQALMKAIYNYHLAAEVICPDAE